MLKLKPMLKQLKKLIFYFVIVFSSFFRIFRIILDLVYKSKLQ